MKELLHLHKLEILILMKPKLLSALWAISSTTWSRTSISRPLSTKKIMKNGFFLQYTPALTPQPERPYGESLKTLRITSISHGWLLGTSIITPIRVSEGASPILTTMADPGDSLKGLTTVISLTWEAWDLDLLGLTTDKDWQILWKG
ncbi:hypothetical protein ACSBR1_034339 [Camellia fascicularis]